MDNYLIHGTNALRGALRYVHNDEFKYDPKSVSVYLSSACKTLSYLVDDEGTLQKISKGLYSQRDRGLVEFEDLMEEFIKPDHALMIAAGMDERMANYFFKDAHRMINIIKSDVSMEPEALRERIKELKYSACESEFEPPAESKSILKRSINIIGGGAIVVTNYSADMIIGGAASALSQAFGGYIAGKGLGG